MKKHAFLILAHNEFDMLKLLIKSIDHVRNDIYVHIDAKAKNFDEKKFETITTQSNLFFINKIPVYWGATSLTDAYLNLMESAYKKDVYEYYHFISGVDIPLKTQDEIHVFFDKHAGIEFVNTNEKSSIEISNDYNSKVQLKQKIIDLLKMKHHDRYMRYHFTQKHFNFQRANTTSKIIYILGRLFIVAQKSLGIIRNRKVNIYEGSGWYSITHNLVSLIIQKRKFIEKTFKFTLCSDELFVQTILLDSPLKENIYCPNPSALSNLVPPLRYVDWERWDKISPYIFKVEDYEQLIKNDALFARKFSTLTDKEIVKKMYYRLLPKEIVDEILK